MSDFRFEKQRSPADLVLSTGETVSGWFFVAGSAATHAGPERIGDLLNAQTGFFPFERMDGTTALYNRAQLVIAALPPDVVEAQLESGYSVARRQPVVMLLSTGARIGGTVAVYRPVGSERLSDYAQSHTQFRYLVTAERTLIVNSAHIVELMETAD